MHKRNRSSHTPELVRDYIWLREQSEYREPLLIEQGADLTAHCMKIDGVWRSPMPLLVDREPFEMNDEDFEQIDPDADDDFMFARTVDDADYVYDYLTDQFIPTVEAELDAETDPVVLTEVFAENDGTADIVAPAKTGVTVGTVLFFSSKLIPRAYNRYMHQDFRSWKATTRAPRQFQRNNPTFRATSQAS